MPEAARTSSGLPAALWIVILVLGATFTLGIAFITLSLTAGFTELPAQEATR